MRVPVFITLSSILILTAANNASAQEEDIVVFEDYFHISSDNVSGSLEADNCGDQVAFKWAQNFDLEPSDTGSAAKFIAGSYPGIGLSMEVTLNGEDIETLPLEVELSQFAQGFRTMRIVGGEIHCNRGYEQEKPWGILLYVEVRESYKVNVFPEIIRLDTRFKGAEFTEFVGPF